MAKQFKIKRYHRHGGPYRAKPHPVSIVLGVLLIAGLIFVGVSIYDPVYNAIMGNSRPEAPPVEVESSQPEETSTPDPEPEPQPEVPAAGELRAVYLPGAIAADPVALEGFLEGLAGTEINGVLVDIKNAAGNVLYDTRVTQAAQWGAVVENPLDLAALSRTLESKNLSLAVRMSAFRDPVAAGVGRENAIYYGDTDWLWLDNSADKGGKPWLSPYAAGSQAYVTDLALEAVELGAKLVVLENFQFPENSLANASFGTAAAGVGRSAVLQAFAASLDRQLEEKGARAAVYVTALSLTQTVENESRYGGNPLEVVGGHVVVGALPYGFGGDISVEGLTVTQAIQDPGAAVEAVLGYVQAGFGTATPGVIPLLQGGNEDVNAAQPYTKAQIDAQIAAAKAQGAEEYILYSTKGAYLLQ